MKKRYLAIALASLFSMSCVACSFSSVDVPLCDPDFEDCDPYANIGLKEDTNSNYTFEDISNENGDVSYEIFVRSFYDSNNDGIGDLNGIREKLPYLKTLGVSNLWLMPIHPSPSYHGYDVADYYGIHPEYGTLDDFKKLVKDAKDNGITIMIDMVLNHSSTQVSWFNQSYNDFKNNNNSANSKKDWYNWSYTGGSGYANYNGIYYEARFDRSMPDLNTTSKGVREEIDRILKYWIDLGVKGFRLDAVKFYDLNNANYNDEFLTFLKDTTDKYDPNIQFVGECWGDTDEILEYHRSRCDSFFNFPASLDGSGSESFAGLVKGIKDANRFAASIEYYENKIKEGNPNGYSSYFLSNHDMNRASNSFYDEYAFPAASLYLLMPGRPYIYYGEEIELEGFRLDGDNSDARRRLPMIWDKNNDTGLCDFPEKNRMDLSENEQVEEGAENQLSTNYSLVNHYRKVINVRNKYKFLRHANFVNETSKIDSENHHILAYSLKNGSDSLVVIHNFNKYNIEFGIDFEGYHIADSISQYRQIPSLKDNRLGLGALSTVVLTK